MRPDYEETDPEEEAEAQQREEAAHAYAHTLELQRPFPSRPLPIWPRRFTNDDPNNLPF